MPLKPGKKASGIYGDVNDTKGNRYLMMHRDSDIGWIARLGAAAGTARAGTARLRRLLDGLLRRRYERACRRTTRGRGGLGRRLEFRRRRIQRTLEFERGRA